MDNKLPQLLASVNFVQAGDLLRAHLLPSLILPSIVFPTSFQRREFATILDPYNNFS